MVLNEQQWVFANQDQQHIGITNHLKGFSLEVLEYNTNKTNEVHDEIGIIKFKVIATI
jgi:hypothetical protein